MNRTNIKNHSFLVLIAVFIICVIFAKGESNLMNIADTGVIMGVLGIVLAYVASDKVIPSLISGVLAGGVMAVMTFVMPVNAILTFGGLFLILASVIVMKVMGRLDHEHVIMMLFIAGFWVQFCYVQYTDVTLRQNDVGYFLENQFEPHHAGYIDYIRHYGWIPSADVREMDQWYHPPLHHLICAYFMRLYGTVFPGLTRNYEVLQLLTLMYSFLSVVFMRRIIRLFDITESTDRIITAFLVSFPIFIINAGELNHDILSVMFFVMSVYFIFRWYKGEKKNLFIALSALCIGLGMMTKLSVWLAAVPVGTVLLAELINTRGRKLKLWGQYLMFGAISFPLGLWFPLRNLIGWGVPLTYIPVPIYDGSLAQYGVFLRLFDFFGNSGYYNIPYFALWSSLFDDDDYRANPVWGLMSFAIFMIFILLVLIAFAGIIYMTYKALKKRRDVALSLALVLMVVAELVSYTIFCFEFPYICTMNFRYIIPVTITFALGMANLYDDPFSGEKVKLVRKIVNSAIIIFAILSVVFYSSLWIYDCWIIQNPV